MAARSAGGKAPLHQEQGAFFVDLAAAHLNSGFSIRLAQKPEKILQQALAVEIPAHLQGEIVGAQHRVKDEGIVIRALVRGVSLAFQDEATGAGFLVQDGKMPLLRQCCFLFGIGCDSTRFPGRCQMGGPD